LNEVLDTRFFIEHFFSSDPGTNAKTRRKLRSLIADGRGIVPSIVLAETVSVVCQRRGRKEAEQRHRSMVLSGLQLAELTSEIAGDAGLLKCRYRDIPFGDCIIAATALELKARVVSDDAHFRSVEGLKRAWL
jgi:predicted nucleic acid-binding protein